MPPLTRRLPVAPAARSWNSRQCQRWRRDRERDFDQWQRRLHGPRQHAGVGKHVLVAVYPGNGNETPSVSTAITQFTSDIPPATLVAAIFRTARRQPAPSACATAVTEDYYVVGMPAADVGGAQDVGAAYVYSRATGALVATLANPAPLGARRFRLCRGGVREPGRRRRG